MSAARRDPVSESEVAAVLDGRPGPVTDPAAFVEMALRHGVAPLLVHARMLSRLPRAEAERLLQQARDEAVISELRDRELRRALNALGAAGVDALLMKGAHLAYSHYPAPHLRPRDDTDLLIASADRDRAAEALARDGYVRVADLTGGLVHGQMAFDRPGRVGAMLDVHWHVAARRVVADVLTFDELRSRSVALPRLGPFARGLSAVDALAIACLHQSAHHPEHDLLLWVYDTHLLVTRLTDDEMRRFVSLAIERGLVAMGVYALDELVRYFPSTGGRALLDRLGTARRDEPAAYLVEPRTALETLASDLSATRGWLPRVQLVCAHLFPPAAYMRRAYGASTLTLPWFYAYRIVAGAVRWLKEKRPP